VGDPAVRFVAFLKQGDYVKAYDLLSPHLKAQISREYFVEEQKKMERQYRQEFGRSGIQQAEELVISTPQRKLSVREQLQVKDVDLSKLFFWNWWKSRPKRRIFQFVFEGGEKVVFGVDVMKTEKGARVSNYEFLPTLQQAIASKNPAFTVKRIRKIT
jgi:hypothetical protein